MSDPIDIAELRRLIAPNDCTGVVLTDKDGNQNTVYGPRFVAVTEPQFTALLDEVERLRGENKRLALLIPPNQG